MDYFFTLIIIIFLIILFKKNNDLKRRIDNQDSIIKYLQNNIESKNNESISNNKVIDTSPIIDYEKRIDNAVKPIINLQKKNSKIDSSINKFVDFLKDNFLTITGIITLVLGIGYFVKYAIDQNWISENLRFYIGIFFGLGVIGVAHKLRKNYEVFSSILIGGGISILYFSLTISFREYHLFSQNITFILLTFVTIFSIVLALLYSKQVLAIFSIIGGFCAPLMISSGESNYTFLFSYLVLLNVSMLYMSFRKKWQIITFIAFVFTSIYSLAWTQDTSSKNQLLFFFINYFIFNLNSLINYFDKKEFSVSNCILLTINTMICTSLIANNYSIEIKEYPALISFLFSFTNLGLFFWIKNTTKNKLLQNTLLGLAITLFTFGIGLGFKANIVSLCFALESTLLLYLWKKSKEDIFKLFFIVMFPFLFIALCINWFSYIETENILPILLNKVFITSTIVSGCSVFNILLINDFEEDEKFLGLKLTHSKLIFTIISILIIYNSILFELIYQIESYFYYQEIICFVLIYTLFFNSILFISNKKLKLNKVIIYLILSITMLCIFLLPIIANNINENSQTNFISIHYYIYILYLIPSIYSLYIIYHKNEFKESNSLQIIFSIVITYTISFEIYNLFMLSTTQISETNYTHQQDIFRLILLPICWAIIGFSFLFIGIKKQLKTFPLLGLILFVLIILKLYFIDVWQMSNVFRIISFIVLGILILLTSFTYQKLKKLMINLIDNKKAQD
ncbi:DUF2339 domain-containing protein [Chishuiella sp.]|uniref:DUF2339 domain-containing protein n=1 Tax=Chishuiella sp. TaxID=1969467 RepID=UPI0028AEDD01|nr:DUF2339 domain-containing protein [Chishuiella sp.]